VIAAVVGTAAANDRRRGAQTAPARNNTLWDGLYSDDQPSAVTPCSTRPVRTAIRWTLRATGRCREKSSGTGYTQKTVGDLFTFIQKNMPNGNGGSLSEKTYADLVALVLKSNGIPPARPSSYLRRSPPFRSSRKDGPAELPAGALVRESLPGEERPRLRFHSATPPQRTDKRDCA